MALIIGGIGIGLFAPNSSSWLGSVAPAESRGKAVGGMTSMLYLGQFFSPIIAQPLINQVGLSATFALAGGAALLIALLFGFAAARQGQVITPAIETKS